MPPSSRIEVVRAVNRPAVELAAFSRSALDRPLPEGAALLVDVVGQPAVLLGTFLASSDAPSTELPIVRRISGGPALLATEGSIWLTLAMAKPAELVDCDLPRLLNRLVRPLLRALSRSGIQVSYFGRDWVSARHRPLGWVGLAHDGKTGRAVFEALIGVTHPVWPGPHVSHRGKSPTCLGELLEAPAAPDEVTRRVAEAYLAFALREPVAVECRDEGPRGRTPEDPTWLAFSEEAIGRVCAGRDRSGRWRIGGEFQASRDAVERFEGQLADLVAADAAHAEVERLAEEVFTASGTFLFGVRSARVLAEVVERAFAITR